MAILITPYTDINATMRGIRAQIIDSIDFCINEMPSFNNVETMFKTLKSLTTYKNDPEGVELLQSVPTLIKNNYWGFSGYGDCDCFSILALSMFVANGFNKKRIVLAGRNKLSPSHIWVMVKVRNKWYDFDLTEPVFNKRREYKFIQYLDC
jgi:hypothetical protein